MSAIRSVNMIGWQKWISMPDMAVIGTFEALNLNKTIQW